MAQKSTGNLEPKRQARNVVRVLKKHFPHAECALQFDSPFQLLIATILSAQCTDQRVNLVTRELFARFPTAADLAKVPVAELEKWIQSTGFFRNKAHNIHSCCTTLVRDYDGKVPRRLEELVQLAGVGRKTANVVLGTAFGIAVGVVVDTHVGRLSRRLGLTLAEDPVRVEQDLMGLLPSTEWIAFSHRMIHLGRSYCQARKPQCSTCPCATICPRISVDVPVRRAVPPPKAK